MKRRTFQAPSNELLAAIAVGEQLKKTPVPAGHVRFERNDYHYGQQGQVARVGHLVKDLPEANAIDWTGYGCFSLTWPDGWIESFDMRVTPANHSFHLGYGTVTLANGEKVTGSLSRLPNLLVAYYGPRRITAEERATFELIHDTWGLAAKTSVTANQ